MFLLFLWKWKLRTISPTQGTRKSNQFLLTLFTNFIGIINEKNINIMYEIFRKMARGFSIKLSRTSLQRFGLLLLLTVQVISVLLNCKKKMYNVYITNHIYLNFIINRILWLFSVCITREHEIILVNLDHQLKGRMSQRISYLLSFSRWRS